MNNRNYRDVRTATPALGESQVKFRLGLARQRTRTYPLDSMDFILMDLERPDLCHRHAHWWTGDLSGRLLEWLSHAEGVDGRTDPRLPELFERILLQRRPSGLIGRYASRPIPAPMEENPFEPAARLFPGLLRYHELTGDWRALDAAVGIAKFALARKDEWRKHLQAAGGRLGEAWICEHMAMLYGATKDQAYLDFAALIEECLESPEKGAHAHGYLATLRGLQVAALVTGDKAWAAKPERYRQTIIEKHYEMPDGGMPEVFPPGARNEGCTIADWMMINLNAGLIFGDDDACARAEHSLWNGFAFNQFITGGFGHREITAAGYGLRHIEEAWWCCLQNGGLAMAEYARQAVTWRDGAISVNLLLPGTYRLELPGRPDAELRILSSYPAAADTVVEARHVPAGVKARLRVPDCVKRAEVTETRDGDAVCIRLKGTLGHHVESCSRGQQLFYGPLLLAPVGYNWSGPVISEAERGNVPTGYIPDDMPRGLPALQPGAPDADGLLRLSAEPLPDWTFYDGGPGAKCWVPGAAANIPVKFPGGQVRSLWCVPQCCFTSCMAFHETPIIFARPGG